MGVENLANRLFLPGNTRKISKFRVVFREGRSGKLEIEAKLFDISRARM